MILESVSHQKRFFNPKSKKDIATYKTYTTEEEAIAQTFAFINEQTPLLFNAFQGMENVPILTRNNYTL